MTEADIQKLENEKAIQHLASAYKGLFSSDKGKRVLADLETFCGQLASSVRDVPIDPYQTHFNEGKRRVYLRIHSMINRRVTK